MAKKVCQKCGRTKDQSLGFYTYKDGTKTELCKECMLMHVNIWQEDTFLWLLQKMDVPYVPQEWNRLREKAYIKNPNKQNDTTVFGKYLSLMKLRQWKEYGWKDSEELQKKLGLEQKAKNEQTEAQNQILREQFEKGQITQAEYRTLADIEEQKKFDLFQQAAMNQLAAKTAVMNKENANGDAATGGFGNFYNEQDFMSEEDIPDLAQDLTQEDKKYLVMKWGRYYKPQEWVQLETFYKQMMDSFDIQDADTRSTLILICKNNLKMNQAIDQGDLEGYQKLARVSDTLRKSAKFTAAQNKQQKSQFIDSVGQLVDYCQKHGHEIPKMEITAERDIVDKVINDLKGYTKSLIYEDSSLARQIEDYIKRSEAMRQNKQDKIEAKEKGYEDVVLTDQDLQEFNQQIAKEKQQDEILREGIKK